MRLPVLDIREVAERHLCCGCGACAYMAPAAIRMVDDLEEGRRPFVLDGDSPALREAAQVCPGSRLEHDEETLRSPSLIEALTAGWGPVRSVWEGWAADEALRRAGSSGGAASALSLFALESLGMHGVLQIAQREDAPILNRTVLSRSREELLERTGSRYAPASPCDGLEMIERAPAPCVFIGKPCDVAAVQAARRLRPALDEKIGLTIAFFCAGTPSTEGTRALLREMGIADPASVLSMRYRGDGWPGEAVVRYLQDGIEREARMTYADSWGLLTRYKQWRCRICPDHTGEFADIAVGDPWYREIRPGEPGNSLIVARTALGERVLREAIEAGVLRAERADDSILPRSQVNLLNTRGATWGRVLAMRLVGMATPAFVRLPTFRFWVSELSLREKAQSIGGTMRRVIQRGLRRRRPVEASASPACEEVGV